MGLSGWNSSKKLKLILDSSKVDEDLINFPVNITLSSGTGQTGFDATAVFDELVTVSGTKKIAITDSNDNKLYVEIERWDWSVEEANLWVRVPTVSSGTNTELFLYYDSTQTDQDTRSISETEDDFTAISGSLLNIEKWNATMGNAKIINNQLHISSGSVYSLFRFSGDFDCQIDFNNLSHPNVDYAGITFVAWADVDNQTYIRAGYVATFGGVNFHGSSRLGGSWGTAGHASRSNSYGKMRISRSGTTVTVRYQDGGGSWCTLFNDSWMNKSIRVRIFTVNTPTVVDLDNFTVNSADSISGFMDDTGGESAKSVWDDSFQLVMHMAQDPNGDVADAIKDSTSNANHGTPAGGMTSADLVDGKVGKAIDFDGVTKYIKTGKTTSQFGIDYNIPFTVQLCINVDLTATGYEKILGTHLRADASGGTVIRKGFYCYTDSTNHFELRLTEDITVSKTWMWESVALVNGWNQIDFIYDGNNNSNSGKLYMNNVLVDSIAFGGPIGATIENNYQIFIGAENYPAYPGQPDIANQFFDGTVDGLCISNINRSAAWIKATYYSNWDDFVTFNEAVTFVFTNPIPIHLSTAYGATKQLYLTTTITGTEPNYVYDADFYDNSDVQIGTTISGINSGQPAGVIMATPSGINYSWKMKATSSGYDDTSSLYTFSNMFLCEGITSVNDTAVSGISVRLYRRSTGEYIGGTTSAGVSGTFEIESSFNEYHYVVGFYDSDDTNALIYDWIKPE